MPLNTAFSQGGTDVAGIDRAAYAKFLTTYGEEFDRLIAAGIPYNRALEIAKISVNFSSPFDTELSEAAKNLIRLASRKSDVPRFPVDPSIYEYPEYLSPDPAERAAAFELIRKHDEALAFHATKEARQKLAEEQFAEDCIDLTGEIVHPKAAAKKRREKDDLKRESAQIATRMFEEGGFNARRSDAHSFWLYRVHSQQWEQMENYRRIMFIPCVAAAVRAPKLAALEYFLQKHPYCRFWTFTIGKRVETPRLRQRIRHLNRRLNRLNSELLARYGVSIIFRANETGSLKWDENGNPTWHPHAHCVVYSHVGYIKPDKWAEMYAFIGRFWKYHWNGGTKSANGEIECGVIRNARECCKYVTKPADIMRLDGRQMVELYEAIAGLPLVRPMGILRKEIARRKKQEKVLRRYRFKENGKVRSGWRERENHNAVGKREAHDRAGMTFVEDGIEMASETLAASRTPPGQPVRKRDKRDFCAVVARLAPSMGPQGIKEPAVLVMGTYKDAEAVKNHPLVTQLWNNTLMSWETAKDTQRKAAAAAAPINVHTYTSVAGSPVPFGAGDANAPPETSLFEHFAAIATA